jgi:hypothetical protein
MPRIEDVHLRVLGKTFVELQVVLVGPERFGQEGLAGSPEVESLLERRNRVPVAGQGLVEADPFEAPVGVDRRVVRRVLCQEHHVGGGEVVLGLEDVERLMEQKGGQLGRRDGVAEENRGREGLPDGRGRVGHEVVPSGPDARDRVVDGDRPA